MKKIISEFLTESEANTAMEKINPYCENVRIIHDDMNFNQGHDYYDMSGDDFYGFPETGALNFGGFGGFGMLGGWNFGPNVLDSSYNYNRALSHSHFGHNHTPSRGTTLEAEVTDDNFEYVSNKLYALGAVSVTR